MIEPIYTYVRGQGWSIENIGPVDTYEYTDGAGMCWRLEARKPNPGELGCFSQDNNIHYTRNGKTYLEGWSHYSWFNKDTAELYAAAEDAINNRKWNICWVTKVPLG